VCCGAQLASGLLLKFSAQSVLALQLCDGAPPVRTAMLASVQPRTWRKLLLFNVSVLLALSLGGAYVFQDVRLLLLLAPPSLTYFLLDALRDARHQKELAAQLTVKLQARQAEGQGEPVQRGEQAQERPKGKKHQAKAD